MNITEESKFFKEEYIHEALTAKAEYTYEPHGKGFAIYYGRNNYRHGQKLGMCATEKQAKEIVSIFTENENI